MGRVAELISLEIFMIAGISSFLSIQALSAGLVGYLLVIGVSTAQLVERLGRRKVLLWSLSLLVVFFAILTAFSVSPNLVIEFSRLTGPIGSVRQLWKHWAGNRLHSCHFPRLDILRFCYGPVALPLLVMRSLPLD